MDAGLTAAGRADGGFSLVELVVSAAVLAVLAVGVGLSAGRGVPGSERDAERFRRAVEQNRALAILGREPRGLAVTPRELSLLRPEGDGWTASRLHDWSGAASFVGTGAVPRPGAPGILFHPDGRSTAFSVVFSGRGAVWRCASDGWSEMTCAAD